MNVIDDAVLRREWVVALPSDRIFDQDLPIVESQKPEDLSLDLQVELSLQCDRVSIAYRQYLRELGVTFGVA